MDGLYTYKAKITEVYDADTVTAEIDLGFNVKITEKIRLEGINAPELKGLEKETGIVSRDKLRELLLGKSVFIQTFKDKQEKYGRYLGRIFIPGSDVSVNDWLVTSGFAIYKKY